MTLAGVETLRPLLESLAVAFADDDSEGIADAAFRPGVIAREVRAEVRISDDPALAEYAELLDDLDKAADMEPTTIEDALPLVEALSALVDHAPTVEAACS